MGRRIDTVTVALTHTEVEIPWESREALLPRLDPELRRAFAAVGTSRPVTLTYDQRADLIAAIEEWEEETALPRGILNLLRSLHADEALGSPKGDF